MAVRKPCRSKSCRASPRCEHPWWLDVMYNGVRFRMPVDDFALARGASGPVASKQEAEKVWEPSFIAEIAAGKDPRVAPEPKNVIDRPTTVADLLKLYRARYIDVEPLKSRDRMVSQLNILTAELGPLPAKALERPEAIEDFKARYAIRGSCGRDDESVPRSAASHLQLGDRARSTCRNGVPSPQRQNRGEERATTRATGLGRGRAASA
jgi:hypothetical protein